ncbi:MAG: YggS family pyridoxal phosphate-dependent enzyme [Planctomycetes bacterium]|nr:YggS family pyridoxal phosphate-dependent enzyme [Planctomycetota bacterium]MCC7168879.1 YggS family pyridoxal phosphate-dependent enzyme [Planctomycetota bacterium]
MTALSGVASLLQRNLDAVRTRIAAAAAKGGRTADSVRLVAVTKSVGADVVRELLPLLPTPEFGENRIADAEERAAAVPAGPTWHLIGHLQANKVRRALNLFSWVHSVDDLDLLARIDRIAQELGRRPRILLQVNVSGEASKSGCTPEALRPLAQAAAAARHVEVVGLMTMAPLDREPEASRPWFRALRQLRDELARTGDMPAEFVHLSMGMTNDFEIAVEEGATLVRVGRALFLGLGDSSAGPHR